MTPHAFMLLLLGALATFLGTQCGVLGLVMIWLGIDFLVIGAAYCVGAHGIFGKRPDGTLPFWSWWVFLPYYVLSISLWNAGRILSREPAFNRVNDSLVVSRRLIGKEIPQNYSNYVDLTAEFQEPKAARDSRAYLSVPVLDATAPSLAMLTRAVESLKPGVTLVHCAQGHGRTGLFALAVLLARGIAKSVPDGLAILQQARPRISLTAQQIACAQEFERSWKGVAA